jgi:hypothetical protein
MPKVHSISRPKIQTEFVHATADRVCVAEIAEPHARQTAIDSLLSFRVKVVEPFRERHRSCGCAVKPDFPFQMIHMGHCSFKATILSITTR